MDLKDRICLITGAGRGMGRAIACLLAQNGAHIAGVARTKSEVEAAMFEVTRLGRKGLPIVGDVSREDDVRRLVLRVEQELGGIDILVNGAGIAPRSSRKPIEQTLTADWDAIIDVNLRGSFLMIREVLPYMKRKGSGFILNITSVAGKRALGPDSCAYHASKFGLLGLTRVLERDIRESGISVSAVSPGRVFTGMGETVDLGQYSPSEWMKPEDIAEVALFLVTRPKDVIIPEVVVYPRSQIGLL